TFRVDMSTIRHEQSAGTLMTLGHSVTGVNMVFAHDTELALVAAAALVNTAGGGQERLPDLAALDEFFVTYGWSGRRARTEARPEGGLRGGGAPRPRLRRLWAVGEPEVVEIVNELLREFNALPQLVRHEDWPYHLHATPLDSPLATRMAVEAAMAFVDVVRGG